MTFAVTLVLTLVLFASPEALGQTPANLFAAFDSALDHRLAAMLQGLQVRSDNAPVVHEPADMPNPVAIAGPIQIDTQGDVGMFAQQFWGGRGKDLDAALIRLQAIRPTLESILQSEGVPKDLIGVVLVESAAQPLAQSSRQARGLWQLIPETARRYGLKVGGGRDERIEIEHATRAAARYLRDLYQEFENWPLALAAYNAGQDAVQKALGRSRATTFQELSDGGSLPWETRTYVPAVLAAMKLMGSDRPVKPAALRGAPWIYALIGTADRDFLTPDNGSAPSFGADRAAR